jgi:circadian clock protein KaiC
MAERTRILSIPSGVNGLDVVLGGGLPEHSLNLIAGGPGVGKTTLAQQIAFAAATPERPALYFTVLGEPAVKLLRYQSQFSFFDPARVGSAIQFVNLSREVAGRDFKQVIERIQAEVEEVSPRVVVVDSFRTVGLPGASQSSEVLGANDFVHRLAEHLTTWEVTSFLIGEYGETEQRFPVFTVADGILWMSQETDRNSVVRKLQVMKVRGRAPMPGLHTYRITNDGVQIFPRIPEQQLARKIRGTKRHTTGVPGLDEMIGGGVPAGDAVMLAGPAGSGKTTFATQFIAEGLRCHEAVVVAAFEEYPREYVARAHSRDIDLQASIDSGALKILYLRPLDLSVDEALAEILDAVKQIDAERVVIDSLSGFEIALAPAFREDFRESLYRLVGALTATGVTVLMTAEIVGELGDARFTTERVSFITDDIIVQRFVEIEGVLRKVLVVVKMRGSAHSGEFREYEITDKGATVGGPMHDYHGIITGVPHRHAPQAGALTTGKAP